MLKKYFVVILALFCTMNTILLGSVSSYATSGFNINSATLAPGYETELSLTQAEYLGIDTINISVKLDIEDINSSRVAISEEEKLKFENTLKVFSERGYKIYVEPFPWIAGGTMVETDYNPSNKKVFFKEWENALVNVLEITKQYSIDGFLIADNFYNLINYNKEWDRIISKINCLTDSKLGIKINWWYNADFSPESYEYYYSLFELKYLNNIDFISIPAYFELLDEPTEDVDRIINAWHISERFHRRQRIFEQIKVLSDFYQKPIFFGEVGYTSYTDCLISPWNYFGNGEIDEKYQKAAFEGFYRTFENQNFVCGYSLFVIGSPESMYNMTNNRAGEWIQNYLN